MKQAIRLFVTAVTISILATATVLAQVKKPMTNDDVIQMVKAGFAEDTIIKAVETSQPGFDISVQGLLALKESGVSEKIITSILSAQGTQETVKASASIGSSGVPQDRPVPNSSSPQAQGTSAAADQKAAIYVYRYKQFNGSALEPSIFVDDHEVARMDNGRYFILQLPGETHTFRSNDKQSGIEVDLKPGETYFLRVEIAAGFFKGHGRLVHMMSDQGQFEIKKLQYLGSDKIKDKKLVLPRPLDPPVR
ncbi:MAG: hypothetical protein A3H28_08435 [Acidobacteria bacterium RIFCSPLOWO2_02_FULL_61_28]|nr:MAG: hypothetical protein A3H28_08435 [Acidobacteria bacterium RIFCSPLOWO2_02_FULL_61_28]